MPKQLKGYKSSKFETCFILSLRREREIKRVLISLKKYPKISIDGKLLGLKILERRVIEKVKIDDIILFFLI